MPGQSVLSRSGWVAVILLAAAVAGLLQRGPERLGASRADRTAARFVSALDRHCRVVGEALADQARPAMFDFFIVAERPSQVDRYFADLRGAPWAERFRGCQRGG